MTLLEAISPTARELLPLHCTPPRHNHTFFLGECMHCGAKKAVVLASKKQARAAYNQDYRKSAIGNRKS